MGQEIKENKNAVIEVEICCCETCDYYHSFDDTVGVCEYISLPIKPTEHCSMWEARRK